MYFHCLFWPAMLMGSNFALPKKICIHGFLTVNGVKMSKSRGTFIKAETFAKHIEPHFLRYYYASKLTNSINDIDLAMEDFVNKINADIVGNMVNLFSRATKLMTKLDSRLGALSPESPLIHLVQKQVVPIAENYEERNFSQVTKMIMRIFDDINKYFNDTSPWIVIKKDPEQARTDLTTVLIAATMGAIMMKPILPAIIKRIEHILNCPDLTWDDLDGDPPKIVSHLEEKSIGIYERLAERIDSKAIGKIIKESIE